MSLRGKILTCHASPANALRLVVTQATALPVVLHFCDALIVFSGQIGVSIAFHRCIDKGLAVARSGISTCSKEWISHPGII